MDGTSSPAGFIVDGLCELGSDMKSEGPRKQPPNIKFILSNQVASSKVRR